MRVLARGVHRAQLPAGVDVAAGTVADLGSVRAALDGCDACVHLAAIIVERGEQTFDAVNTQGTRNVVAACEAAGVGRVIHLSALGADAGSPFAYLASKGRGEDAVASSSVDWTILRPSALHGPRAGFFRPIVWTARWMPVYPLPNGGRTRFQPLWIDDLAQCVVRALDGAAVKQRVDLGGPETMTFRQIVEAVMRALGKRRRMVSVPLWAARPFATIQERRRDPLVTNDQLDMVVVDNACDPDEIRRVFGVDPRRFEDTDLRWLALL